VTADPETNGWRARVVGDDPVSDSVRIVAGVRGGNLGSTYLAGIGENGVQLTHVEPGAEGPSFAMPVELAQVLLDALAEHFGGTSVGRQARADFVHERGRVDKLIETVSTIAVRSGGAK
jgi:hypothetical protein